MKSLHWISLVNVMLIVIACGRATPGVGANPLTRAESILVEVNNQNFYDADITVVFQGSSERRLGLVVGNTRDTFHIRWQPEDLVFGVDLIGGPGFFTERVVVVPGDALELILPVNLHRGAPGFRRR